MGLRTKVFAMTYDRQIARSEKAGLRAFREDLLVGVQGHVIEIGGGTGANLPCYGPGVESLTITEPQLPMLHRLERKVREQGRPRSCARGPRTFPSMMAPSTWRSPRWSCAASTISPGLCGNCGGCSGQVAGSCSSSTCGPRTPAPPACRTG